MVYIIGKTVQATQVYTPFIHIKITLLFYVAERVSSVLMYA